MPGRRPPSARTSQLCMAMLVLALLTHAWLVTRNWRAGFMPGHEFRQAQTAIIADYIDRQDNFSLLYETPILGKPWVSLLLEVPVYEWSVVLVSRATGVPHFMAARAVSVACFYLTLPALALLLARLGIVRPFRFLVLALIVVWPVYIFYSRAFLIDSMELMCCAWFLYGFVQTLDRRRWYWFLLAAVAGTGAALIKSATLAVWLLPAAAYGAWMLWRDVRDALTGRGWGAPFATLFWGLASAGVPLGLLKLWMGVADSIKEVHASAWIFTSRNLSVGNWGLTDIGARFSAGTWGVLLDRWREAIMPPWLVLAAFVAGVAFARGYRARIFAIGSVFFLAQLMFPYAYAYQDYYFYSCALFLAAAVGLGLQALIESPAPRWLCWLALVVMFVAPLRTYAGNYYRLQMVPSNGGFPFTEALDESLPADSVIVVAGADWGAMIPLYTKRRALMIRNGLENDTAYLQRAFGELGDEDVGALILVDGQRGNEALARFAAASFDLTLTPTFSHAVADIYCNRRYLPRVAKVLREHGYYGQALTAGPLVTPSGETKEPFRVSGGRARNDFKTVVPAPMRAHFAFGYGLLPRSDHQALFMHPNCDLWVHAPRAATRIEWDFGIEEAAYSKENEHTDGVEFIVTGTAGGTVREIYRRVLDPAKRTDDRGPQREIIPYQPRPGEILAFSTRPVGNYSFDWAYSSRIEVK